MTEVPQRRDVPPQRLAKVMAQRGLCSRREAERLIASGSVLVDGRIIDQQGVPVQPDAAIEIRGVGRDWLARRVSVLLHKPVGLVSTQPEDGQTPAWTLITRERLIGGGDAELIAAAVAKPWHLAVAGRLDLESRGLLLLTSDGVLARRVTGGHELAKRYQVAVERAVDEATLQRLNGPLRLDGRDLLPMRVRRLEPRLLEFELREGRKHQIRRVCRDQGLRVADLLRTAIGPWRLGDLPEGHWRLLTGMDERG